MKKKLPYLFAFMLLACNQEKKNTDTASNSVQTFLSQYNSTYQQLTTDANEALWNSLVHVGQDDSIQLSKVNKTAEQLAEFTGSKNNIETTLHFLKQQDSLTDLQYRQLKRIAYMAANNPQTIRDVVTKKIKLETDQNQKYFDFDFKLNGKSITEDGIDSILVTETNLKKRKDTWECSKEVGIRLKKGLADLRDLRNTTVQTLGYKDFFSYQVADYNMSSEEMIQLLKKINKELRPLYRELHTYMRYELAKKYNVKEVPDLLPADWLPNRWGQDWSSIIQLNGVNLDSTLKTKKPDWILTHGEDFFVSMGFPKLPASFWEKSDLYPVPPSSPYKKNVNTSSWHMDLGQDVRLLMAVENNTKWYEFINHELTHMYNFMLYAPTTMPVVLRTGTNRAYFEAMGRLTEMTTSQRAFLENAQLVNKDLQTDDLKKLLKEALNYVVFIPFSTGTLSMFEYDLYAQQLPEQQFNSRWWQLAKEYQGIAPPADRGEMFCDAATKMHIHGSPAQYYDYALSSLLMFQFNDYIAQHFLHQNPRNTNYFGNKETGEFMMDLMKEGGSRDWKDVLKEKTGSELDAKAMLIYFSPLMDYLKRENQGRKYTLPDI
jgi:peptidyl-dipeptidase A